MKDGNEPDQNTGDTQPHQTDEKHGKIKSPQRGPDDFQGKSDTARGSGPSIRGTSGQRG